MKGKQEIRLAGFGGQGIVLSGHILGKAATLFERRNAVFTQSYGPEARGGSCSADVVISEGTIHYPKVARPNVLVLMSQGALNTYGELIADDGVMIIDQDLVSLGEEPQNVRVYRVPFTRIAEELGRAIVANIVMLGALAALGGVVTYESLKESVVSSIPAGTEELNLAAFNKGFDYAQSLLKPDAASRVGRRVSQSGPEKTERHS
jgi:2-oxoglutarate ferredoxin oxidoreductase subunit gamma